jgi:hypothetical protein
MVDLEVISRKVELSPTLRGRLSAMTTFLRFYAASGLGMGWIEASELAATGAGKGPYLAKRLCQWVSKFIETRELPQLRPTNVRRAMISDEDLASDIRLHLQSIGKFVKAADIVEYMGREEVKVKFGLTKTISERTACRWFHAMSFRFGAEKKGMYVDGHKREDVVKYRQDEFLPMMAKFERRMTLRDRDGKITQEPQIDFPEVRRIELYTHDESTFYANDQRKTRRWIGPTEGPTLVHKGDGISIMVSDFVSPTTGYLRSRDGYALCSESSCKHTHSSGLVRHASSFGLARIAMDTLGPTTFSLRQIWQSIFMRNTIPWVM